MGRKPLHQKALDDAEKAAYKAERASRAITPSPHDTTLGTKLPKTRRELDMYLDRFILEARSAQESGGKVTFSFRRREAGVKIVYPDLGLLDDFEGS